MDTLNISLYQEITLSGGKCFHFSCFKCEVCGVDLSKRKYAYTGGMISKEPFIQQQVYLYQYNRNAPVRAVYQDCGKDNLP